METENPDNLLDLLHLSTYKENWTGRDGRTVILRSIRSKDKQIEKELIDGLSVQSSRYRFLHVIKEATEEMINQFCDIDYKNEIAIIAEYNSNGKKQNVGVVRLFVDPNLQTGEFAILVADNFQDSGLGTKFMETLIKMGRKKGLKSIYGIVLIDNNKMLTLAKEFGFIIGTNSCGESELPGNFSSRNSEQKSEYLSKRSHQVSQKAKTKVLTTRNSFFPYSKVTKWTLPVFAVPVFKRAHCRCGDLARGCSLTFYFRQYRSAWGNG